MTVETDSIGRTGMVALCVGVYLVLGLFTDFLMSLPEKYKTPWPALLTWSALMVGLAKFLLKRFFEKKFKTPNLTFKYLERLSS